MKGTVKWFSRTRGYGFIQPDDGGPEHIAHYSEISGDGYRNLYDNQRVEFQSVATPKGFAAREIQPLNDGE